MYAGQHAVDHPDDPVIVMATSGEVITYAEYEGRCNQFAHLLRDMGLKRSDHVAFFMENNARMLECERDGVAHAETHAEVGRSEDAHFLGLHRGLCSVKFPLLWRRWPTSTHPVRLRE